jgi:phage terminase large subunit-like protein
MRSTLAAPDRSEFEPFTPTPQQGRFLLRLYELHPATGRRRWRRAVYSRPKGAGKSPLLGAVMLAEALADVVPDGWDAFGQPVGRPWRELRTPWVQVLAVSEDQTRNAWSPMLEMLRDGPACELYPGLDPMDTFIALPRGKGRVEAVTASAASREGNRPVAALLDQTESWTPSNGGVRLAAVTRRNLAKTNGVSVEAPNAYVPGLGSVAQASHDYAKLIAAGRARDDGLLWDAMEASPGTRLDDRASLLAGLSEAYGDALDLNGGWVDSARLVADIWDPATDPADARQYYLNLVTHAADSWLSYSEWAACADLTRHLADRDVVTLGFDGSVRSDATALVACRVSDAHCEPLGVWEAPHRAPDGWQVDVKAVHAVVDLAFRRFAVIGFYADPPFFQDACDAWTVKYGRRLKVRASKERPIEWWTNRPAAMVAALERAHTAVLGRALTHDGDSALTAHAVNARRRVGRSGVTIGKEFPQSERKIDAVMAMVLAYEARCDAVAQGHAVPRSTPQRLR